MTTLTIEQGNNIEIVSSAVIQKLYETALNSTNVTLSGNLQCDHCFENAYDYLTGYITEGVKRFPNLAISVTGAQYISFADPEIQRVLSNWWGDGTGITAIQMATKTELTFSSTDSVTSRKPFINNTSVRTFNELGRFTTIKTIGTQTFERAYIESIDLSNIEYINWASFTGTHLTGTINLPSIKKLGAGTGPQQGDCFSGTNITNVICGPNLELLGQSVFKNCTSLQTVTGLSNLTSMANECFSGCTSLTSVDLNTNIAFGSSLFSNCSNLETIGTWVNDTVSVGKATFNGCENLVFPDTLIVNFEKYTTVQNGVTVLNKSENYRTFRNCKKLKKVILQETEIQLGKESFGGCTSLTEIVNTDKIKWIGIDCFNNCPISGTLDLSGCDGNSGRNSGSDLPESYRIISNMPNITKVIFGGWVSGFRGDWATYSKDRSFFYNCPNLTTVDFGIIDGTFPNYRGNINSILFADCPNMTTLIIRNTSVLELANASGTVESKDVGGSTVTLYVPDDIVNDYKTAAGWSNIANQIKGISELPS